MFDLAFEEISIENIACGILISVQVLINYVKN